MSDVKDTAAYEEELARLHAQEMKALVDAIETEFADLNGPQIQIVHGCAMMICGLMQPDTWEDVPAHELQAQRRLSDEFLRKLEEVVPETLRPRVRQAVKMHAERYARLAIEERLGQTLH
ncbi:MAG: hypothetical protein IRY96_07415 [Burkholderiales bacterium]|nr:hypothetical protein [Burkholderiales bacterium]